MAKKEEKNKDWYADTINGVDTVEFEHNSSNFTSVHKDAKGNFTSAVLKTPSNRIFGNKSKIESNDYSKKPWSAKEYADMRGVVDFGNLFQFAPFETGYSFIAVINDPNMANLEKRCEGNSKAQKRVAEFKELQDAFVKILEQEFKGLSGLGDITAETMDVANDGINTLSLLGKVTQERNCQLSMNFTEKSGSIITKYISTYLRFIRDTSTQAKTYGGAITAENASKLPGYYREVFNLLYVVTDSTCLNIEKAFLILNAQPMNASYSELYSSTKGEIGTKDLTVTFNAFVVDGTLPNKIAYVYMRSLIKTATNPNGRIQLDSYDFDWSISGLGGPVRPVHISELALDVRRDTGEYKFRSAYNGAIDKFDSKKTNTYLFDDASSADYKDDFDPKLGGE